MRVRKRNGRFEPVDVNKIVRAVQRCAGALESVDPLRVATRTISGLYDGATTAELDQLSIQTAASLIAEEPQYSRLAARLLATYIEKEAANQEIHSFSQSIRTGHDAGLISDQVLAFVEANKRKLNDAVNVRGNELFEYFGLRTVYDRYLLKHPKSRKVIETPQYFFLRVACGLAQEPQEAIEFYQLISSLAYLPSSPTLFNSGGQRTQLSSCYLLDSPQDDLVSIYDRYTDVAKLSKYAGGIGLAYHRVRAKGSLIRGTNGHSNGIVPWLKTLDSSVAAVNQGGRRKGAACVYLETWHADIEDFLELRDNTGDDARRTHNLNLANWVPDLFMRRVEGGADWSLFDPKVVPHLTDLFGADFERAYEAAEADGLAMRKVPARDLYARMMRTLAQTGNGWMTFKDASNEKCNQTGTSGEVVHLSNLCTEIIEVTSAGETAVCNLGSINVGRFVSGDDVDYARIGEVARKAVAFLDRVIDINYYPTEDAKVSNDRWRPVGLGLMGLQDVFFQLRLPFDSPRAREISRRIQAEIYYNALLTSVELAEKNGPHPAFSETRAAKGVFQFELWGGGKHQPRDMARFEALRTRMVKSGLRNSLMIAIAPTATIASIAGCYECIEPQVSNLFKRETLSGDFVQINGYLVRELKRLGLWTEDMRARIKRAEGSVQGIQELPAELREVYRTAWEIPMRSLIDMAAERGPYIDQSQSLNLFIESPTIGKLSSMYLYAWKQGLKTTYYMRSRPATRITQVSAAPAAETPMSSGGPAPAGTSDSAAVACSLENPESCEACQ
ncbi:MAG: ribonucleoside-diphosphate reductase subunit alpha [Planctomycetaceae bacterium]|nr:ribonucleoside-diphosphate reductase subunit alpha [Planctomycetaceae bacterium]